MDPNHAILLHLLTGQSLSERQAQDVFERILSGNTDPSQIGAILALIASRGPTVDELVGGARVMRRHVTPVHATPLAARHADLPVIIDTCGTGGAPKTFNVSTIGAFVVAAAGDIAGRRVAVAKHGSTSRTGRGSAEVLQTLGVNTSASPEIQARCLAEIGVCFCFSIHHHPAMKHAAGPRKSLGFPTIFNLLGPLTNPAGAQRQLIGTFSPDLALKIAHTLARLGVERAMVVHAHDGLDELSTTDTTLVHEVRAGAVSTRVVDALSLGLPRAQLADLQPDSLDAAAALFRTVLESKPCNGSAALDMVLLNAAGALIIADVVPDFAPGIILARQAITSGRALDKLEQLIRLTSEQG